MPMDKRNYPPDWRAISKRIRAQANQQCQECGVVNGAFGARDKHDKWHDVADIDGLNSDVGYCLFGDDYPKIIRIVLIVAHLDHNTWNNDDSNLKSLCQRCRLRLDGPRHKEHAKATRARKKAEWVEQAHDAVGQQRLDL